MPDPIPETEPFDEDAELGIVVEPATEFPGDIPPREA